MDIPPGQKVRNWLVEQLGNQGSESHQRKADEHGYEKAQYYRSEAEKLSEDRAEQPPIPFAQFILPLFGMGHTFEHIPYPLILCFALRLHGLRGVPAFLWLREVPILFRQFRRGSKPVRMRKFSRKESPQFFISAALRCRERQHGNAQPLLKQLMVDLFLLRPCYVHHVEQQNRRFIQGSELRDHIHASLQLRGIHQNADKIGQTFFDEIRSNDFLIRIAGESVAAWKVRHRIPCPVICIEAILFFHCLTRPVADMLPGTGQCVKYC